MEKYKSSPNNKEARLNFVRYWAEYVKTHPDEIWSRQQNKLINSILKSATQLSRKEYLDRKGEPHRLL